MHQRGTQRGFTVVELMIVVAIIAVLAAVVIPSFLKESSRGRNKSEVSAVFAELGTRMDVYKNEHALYLNATSTTSGSIAACPASASTTGTNMLTAACATSGDWAIIGATSPQGKLYCSYVITDGPSSVTPVTLAPTWAQGYIQAPATSWYFIVATCPDNEYFTASWDSKIQSKDGK